MPNAGVQAVVYLRYPAVYAANSPPFQKFHQVPRCQGITSQTPHNTRRHFTSRWPPPTSTQVIVWSPQSRRPLATLQGHASAVHGLAIDPGTHSGHPPRWVASGGGEGFLLVWDPRNWGSPVATLRGEVEVDTFSPATTTPPSLADSLLSPRLSIAEEGAEGGLRGGLAGARLRGESGRWEGETTGATMLNGVNCLAPGGAGGAGDWLFAAGETVVRSWQRRDGVWHGGAGLPGEGLGGIASLSVVE